MSRGHETPGDRRRRRKRQRQELRHRDYVPTFHDPELQQAFKECRPILDAHRDRMAWADAEAPTHTGGS